MIKIFIDEKPFDVEEGLTIFNAAEQNGISIPHLCYHPAFPPEGTCRMCLVEIEGVPKLELSCSTRVRDGMKIFTHSNRVKEARRGVLEFLLAEHPIDCPICDQAGDCKLQDYYDEYGLYDSQFREKKEKREKKVEIGKNLLLDQERCILCRRCIRFLSEVTKTRELGLFNRGNHTEINVYDGLQIDNNYSGNLAQLCPVGAITDKDFRFQTRNWFLDSGESICPLCSRGCRISIDYHKGFARFPVPKRAYRVQAEYNPDINGYWICDMGRYGYGYINESRLEKALTNNGSKSSDMNKAIEDAAKWIVPLPYVNKTKNIILVLNTWLSNEELYLIKKIFHDDLGVKKIYFTDLPDGKRDDILMTAERTPNKRGARELGFDLDPFDLDAINEKTDMIIVFGSFMALQYKNTELHEAFGLIEHKILFTPNLGEFTDLFDLVLPVSLIPEKAGSLTNVDGIIQEFTPALEPTGDSRAEWEILVEIGNIININLNYYKQFSSTDKIRTEMGKEIPFFRK